MGMPAMAERHQGQRRGRLLGGVRPTGEDDRVTTFELFFDLVYVFAATQVTGYMAHEHTAHGVAQGLLLLALLWWTWSAYAWLGTQARADEGVLRAGMAVAMAAIFVVALTIPEAWQDAPGGLNGPLVAIGVLLAALPAAAVLPPLVGLAGLVLVLAALIVVETTRYAQTRRDLRGAA
jgi:hypothetical protein